MSVMKTAVAAVGMLDADPRMAGLFGAVFGAPPTAIERAPARVNCSANTRTTTTALSYRHHCPTSRP